MPKGQPRTKEEIQEIVEYYQSTKSIYQTYKTYKSSYSQIKKYLLQSGVEIVKPPVDGKRLLPQLKSQAPYIYKEEDIKKEDKDILGKIRKDILSKDTDKTLSPNISKDQYYIKNINIILTRMINMYKRELTDIPIKALYLHFGTLFDKLNHLTGKDKLSPDSQVIMNFYGDDVRVKSLIAKIKQSKGSL